VATEPATGKNDLTGNMGKGGLLTPYLRRRRSEAALPWLRSRILDVGCGEAELAGQLQPGQSYTGIELKAEVVEALRQRFPNHAFYQCDVERDPFPCFAQQFDSIVLTAVVEHLEHPDQMLARCSELLQPRGVVIVTTPSPLGFKIHKLAARIGLAQIEAAREHKRAYGRTALTRLLTSVGLVPVSYRRFLLGFNQLMIAGKRDG